MKKLILPTAIAASMVVSTAANADVIDLDWSGMFTMGNSAGDGVVTNAGPDAADAFGIATFVNGTMQFDTATGAGSATMEAFLFSGNTLSLTPGLTNLTAIGDGLGGSGTLILASMDFTWGTGARWPVYVIGDAAGFFGASGPDPGTALSVGDVITGVGAISSTVDSMGAYAGYAAAELSAPMPFAMTTLDVNQDGAGALIGGGFPITDDGISGVSMATAPFPGHHANFDITTMTITGVTPIPVPATVWLFGSGLFGLLGVACNRRKKC